MKQAPIAADLLEAPVGRHPTLEECHAAGRGPANHPGKKFEEGGLPDTPEERARFEAYMRGHCWAIGKYDNDRHCYDTQFVRCCYGVWRDRGALPTVNPNAGEKMNEKQQRQYLYEYSTAKRDIELTEAAISILERVSNMASIISMLKRRQHMQLRRIDSAAEKLGAPYGA